MKQNHTSAGRVVIVSLVFRLEPAGGVRSKRAVGNDLIDAMAKHRRGGKREAIRDNRRNLSVGKARAVPSPDGVWS